MIICNALDREGLGAGGLCLESFSEAYILDRKTVKQK